MSAASLGIRTGSYGSLQQLLYLQNGSQSSGMVRRPSKMALSTFREKERCLPLLCRFLRRRKVAMLMLVVLALLVFVFGSFTVNKENNVEVITEYIDKAVVSTEAPPEFLSPPSPVVEDIRKDQSYSNRKTASRGDGNRSRFPTPRHPHPHHRTHSRPRPAVLSLVPHSHPRATVSSLVPVTRGVPWGTGCENFAFPPPPPPDRRWIGPRSCPVCYRSVEDAISSMPSSPTTSPVLQNLTYVYNEDSAKVEEHGGSEFGGYSSLKDRNDSFDIKESMNVHCGFVKGIKSGQQTGFDIDEADLVEMEKPYDVIVASGVFGNYDVIQQPKNISKAARRDITFFMFIDEETEAYMKNASVLGDSMKVGLWKIIVVHNTPFADSRRNGKVPKLLLHRLFPSIRYSIWIDGKLELVVDPYQVLERFCGGKMLVFQYQNTTGALMCLKRLKLIKQLGNVPEGCVIVREHIPITNLFTCLWFNEVDRFTLRDQLSFSTVRDKIPGKVNWSINMFLDCERRNFVIQAYHRDLLEQMSPPPPPPIILPVVRPQRDTLPASTVLVKPLAKTRRRRGDRKGNSRRHHKGVPR